MFCPYSLSDWSRCPRCGVRAAYRKTIPRPSRSTRAPGWHPRVVSAVFSGNWRFQRGLPACMDNVSLLRSPSAGAHADTTAVSSAVRRSVEVISALVGALGVEIKAIAWQPVAVRRCLLQPPGSSRLAVPWRQAYESSSGSSSRVLGVVSPRGCGIAVASSPARCGHLH